MVPKPNPHGSLAGDVSRNGAASVFVGENPGLTSSELDELTRYEAVISARLRDFFEVGRALIEISRKKLYRRDYATFEEYCHERWDMSRIHAFRLLKAAEVHQVLLPIGNIALPENEAQIRPLTTLPPKKAKIAWEKVLKKAGADKITAKLVRQVVSEFNEKVGANEAKQKRRNEWQHEVHVLLKKIHLATAHGKLQEASQILEKIRVVLDIEIGKEVRSNHADPLLT
jgi:hypothetical protein